MSKPNFAGAGSQLGFMGFVTTVETALAEIFGIGSTGFDGFNMLLLALSPVAVPLIKGLFDAWVDDGKITGGEFRSVLSDTADELEDEWGGER